MNLSFGVATFAGTVTEDHVLQFALATLITNRAIEGVIRQQEFEGRFPRGLHLSSLRADHHAGTYRKRTSHLHFWHFFHFHQTHAAGCLQRVALVVAEGRNLNPIPLCRFNNQHPGRSFQLLPVDRKFNQISHYAANPELLK